MASPFLISEIEKNVRNEAENLFVDYLKRHQLTETLKVFCKESSNSKNNSQTSNRSYLQNPYSTIEDMIMNVNFGENARRKYMFSTCKSFTDIIIENSHRLMSLIYENSKYVDNKNDLNKIRDRDQFSHSFFSSGNVNNNGTFVQSQNNLRGINYLYDNGGSMPFETVYNSPRYVSNPCNTNVLPSNLSNVTPYLNTNPPIFHRTESFPLNSGRLNGFRPINGSHIEGSGVRGNINCDVPLIHNGCFVPNGSSTPRIVSNETGGKKGTHIVLQNGNLATPNCYTGTNQFIHNGENHVTYTQYSGGYLHGDSKNALNDSGMSVLSSHSPNFSNITNSNSNMDGKEKRSRANSSLKTTAKGKWTREGNKTNSASKRKSNSSCDGGGKKIQKLDDEISLKSGVLDFQTTLSPSQFRKAAKDVDLVKEPHLAKKYPSEFSGTDESFKPENLLNLSKFRCEQGNGNDDKKKDVSQQSRRILNSPSLKIPGFGGKIVDENKSFSDKNDVFKSPSYISPQKNGTSNNDSILINNDHSEVSSFSNENNTDSTNFDNNIDDMINLQDFIYPFELCQENSLEFNSEYGFDLDSSILFDPGRELELFDEIGYCKNDGSFCSNNKKENDDFLPDIDLSIPSLSHIQHSFLVIHPKIRWGKNATPPNERNEELQVEEAVALVKTIPGFSVSQSVIVGTDYTTKKKQIWGQGRIDGLLKLKSSSRVSAIMINVDYLTPSQQNELYNIFKVPIFDRYNIVVRIFKLYAKTNLAHYQVQLAEIPYIKNRLHYLDNNNSSCDILQITDGVNVLTNSGLDRKEALRLREHALRKKIKNCIESTKNEIEEKKIRQSKKNVNNSLIVAIVGYTNVGKTTFIKKITGSSQLNPEDKLFATLDTTIHPLSLPSGSNVFIADTIGFMGSLPVGLFESFSATLMHATSADLLIHLFDLSHPDVFSQKKNVLKSLIDLKFPQKLIDNMICVGNKLDKITDDDKYKLIEDGILNENDCVISSISGYGINELILKIDKNIMNINNSRIRRFKLKPESKLISYFYENKLVTTEPVISNCGKYLIFDICLNDGQLNKLKKKMNFMIKKQ